MTLDRVKELVGIAQNLAEDYHNDMFPERIGASGHCLVKSWLASSFLQKMGVDAQLQAGSACFRFVPEEEDDGERVTHFSYIYEEEKRGFYESEGVFPECHCWVGIKHEGKRYFYDPSWGEQDDMMHASTGFRFPDKYKPAEYFFGGVEALKERGIMYEPSPDAIDMAWLKIRGVMAR